MRGGGRLELGTTTSRRRTEASPLLPSVALDARRSPQSRRERSEWVVARKKYLLRLFQFKNETEAKIVLNLVFCGSLANVAFVFGRNAAPAMLISRLGAERLARAMFLSGVSIIAFTPLFSGFAKKRRATAVNACVLRSAAVTLASLYALLAWCGAGRGALVDNVVYSVFYVVEDLATLVVMMQNGAVTQELFSATDARRIVGLVQLGSSLQGGKRVIQRRFNVGVLEAISKRMLSIRPER